MRALRSKGFLAVAVGLSVTLAGCGGPYPDEGTIDTKFLRKHMEIIEVAGNVYGVKTGGLDAYEMFQHDRRELSNMTHLGSEEVKSGEVPQVSLKYKNSDIDVETLRAAMKQALVDAKAGVEGEIAAEMGEVEAKRAEMAGKLEGVSAGTADFDAFVSDAKDDYDTAQKSLNSGIDAYSAALGEPVAEINKVAEANGLNTISSNQNPVRGYRTLDLRGRDMPASCPAQRGYTTVDLRNELNECGYIRIPSGLDPVSGRVVEITKASLTNIAEVEDRLGEKSSWGSDATGLYAKLDEAEERYKAKMREAKNKFGNALQRKRKQDYLAGEVRRLDAKIASLQGDEHWDYKMNFVIVDIPEVVDIAVNDHVYATYDAMYSHIEIGPKLVKDGKNISFDGLGDGLEGAIVLTDIIGDGDGRRESLVTLNYIDLTAPEIKEVGALEASIDRDAIMKGHRVDMSDPDDIEDALVDMVDDAADAREERKASGNA